MNELQALQTKKAGLDKKLEDDNEDDKEDDEEEAANDVENGSDGIGDGLIQQSKSQQALMPMLD
eukprot:13205096-Ditylum_brightwellii.AAC.1